MGVEPTLDQEAGRATVLKTAEHLFHAAPASVAPCRASSNFQRARPTLCRRDPLVDGVRRQVWRQKLRPQRVSPSVPAKLGRSFPPVRTPSTRPWRTAWPASNRAWRRGGSEQPKRIDANRNHRCPTARCIGELEITRTREGTTMAWGSSRSERNSAGGCSHPSSPDTAPGTSVREVPGAWRSRSRRLPSSAIGCGQRPSTNPGVARMCRCVDARGPCLVVGGVVPRPKRL